MTTSYAYGAQPKDSSEGFGQGPQKLLTYLQPTTTKQVLMRLCQPVEVATVQHKNRCCQTVETPGERVPGTLSWCLRACNSKDQQLPVMHTRWQSQCAHTLAESHTAAVASVDTKYALLLAAVTGRQDVFSEHTLDDAWQ